GWGAAPIVCVVCGVLPSVLDGGRQAVVVLGDEVLDQPGKELGRGRPQEKPGPLESPPGCVGSRRRKPGDLQETVGPGHGREPRGRQPWPALDEDADP